MTVRAACTLGLGLLVLSGAAAPGVVAQQQRAPERFPISSVGDSTFAFPVGRNRWVGRGQSGVTVDPRRRDALVARFRVIGVRAGVATALITGQRTEVTTEHLAVLERPPVPWYRAGAFWAGLLVGGAVGAISALAASR